MNDQEAVACEMCWVGRGCHYQECIDQQCCKLPVIALGLYSDTAAAVIACLRERWGGEVARARASEALQEDVLEATATLSDLARLALDAAMRDET